MSERHKNGLKIQFLFCFERILGYESNWRLTVFLLRVNKIPLNEKKLKTRQEFDRGVL